MRSVLPGRRVATRLAPFLPGLLGLVLALTVARPQRARAQATGDHAQAQMLAFVEQGEQVAFRLSSSSPTNQSHSKLYTITGHQLDQ